MTRKLAVACMALAWVTLAPACGSEDGNSSTAGPVGSMEVKVLAPENPVMATIAIQSLFDPENVFVVDCNEKPYPLPGDGTFCDNLVVVPPGVYEVVVQPTDPNCRAEMDWYKVVVEPNQTVEIEITIVCGQANGALDVIVTDEYKPIVTDVNFLFPDLSAANKFICVNGEPVTIQVVVEDSDALDCTGMTVAWEVVDATTGVSVAETLFGIPGDVPCTFTMPLLWPPTLLGDYLVTFSALDADGNATQLTFPIHLIECPPPPTP